MNVCTYICISIVTVFFAVYCVSTCPVNNATWTNRSMHLNCTPWSYHCGFREHGKLEEFCMIPRIVGPKYCPVFYLNTPYGYLPWNCTHQLPLVTAECSELDLPLTYYRTDEMYKYPVCFLGQKLQLDSRIESSSRPHSTPVSDDNAKQKSTLNQKHPSILRKESSSRAHFTLVSDNVKNSTKLKDTSIAIISAIVALLIIALTVNILVFWSIHRKQQQTMTSADGHIVRRISDTDIANQGESHHANTYEHIDELVIQPALIGENENTNIDDNVENFETDKPYDHLDSTRVIVMEGINHACSAL